ncbi:hypothetical protein ACFP81_12085 [Deinococcus lacus]|uniref:Uncharacterized protein n=1 Tax=Deinococcus lacus TaxID=392561 RepID=A0ABW1YGT1_9DEIO
MNLLPLAFLATLAHTLWLAVEWGPAGQQPLVGNLHYLAAIEFSAAAAVQTALRHRGRGAVFASAILAAVVAEGLLIWLETGPPAPRATEWAAEGFYYLSYFLIGVSMLRYSRRRRRAYNRLGHRSLLDSLVVTLLVAGGLWELFLSEVFLQSALPLWERTVQLGYPAADLLLLGILWTLLNAESRPAPALLVAGAGLLAYLAGDILYSYQVLYGAYLPGQWLDLTWTWGTLALVLSTRMLLEKPQPPPRKPGAARDRNSPALPGWAGGLLAATDGAAA